MGNEDINNFMPLFICHDVLQRTRISAPERRSLRKRHIDTVFMENMQRFEGIPVTLAVLGEGLTEPCECIEYIKAHPEWSVQCHGYRHIRYDLVPEDRFKDDLTENIRLIKKVFHVTPTQYIPPYNKYTQITESIARSLGLEQIGRLRKPGYYLKILNRCKQVDFHYWSTQNLPMVDRILEYYTFTPHYIVGAPRSGTTALMRFMSDSDTVSIKEKESLWSEKVKLRDYYRQRLEKSGKSKILDKNVRNSLRIRELARQFPNAKFTHIIRDGRAAISSWRDWARKTGKEDTSIENAARQWTQYVTYIQNNKHLLNNYKEVRYEELCHKHDYFKSRNNKWKKRLSKKDLDIVMRISGELLRRLGYV